MICVDASLVLAYLLPEELSGRADDLLSRWQAEDELLVGPALLPFEVTSGIRRAVYTSRITPREGDDAFEIFMNLPIHVQHPADLLRRSWEIGKRLRPARLYDASYLALAELAQCEVWTIDERLFNFTAGRFPLLRYAGHWEPSA